MRRRATLVLLLAALGCSRSPARAPSPSEAITTDGLLARSNLESMIGGREAMLARDPDSGSVRLTLVTLLQARASTYGRVEDLERAERLGGEAVRRAPRSPEAWLARAASRAAVHRFREAAADLDRAQSFRADPDAVAAQRASIALATGQLSEALTVLRARADREPGMATLSALGVGLAESGDASGAARAFGGALERYRDTSPFPVAFL
ncbi:MAG TPA: hypothetical protein VFF12_04385, partial [Myxococcaceae bacterium]|nr:hypothetical protein [Myxococcaceae bacterium]